MNTIKHCYRLFKRQLTIDPEEFTQEDWQAANTMAISLVTIGLIGNILIWIYILL